MSSHNVMIARRPGWLAGTLRCVAMQCGQRLSVDALAAQGDTTTLTVQRRQATPRAGGCSSNIEMAALCHIEMTLLRVLNSCLLIDSTAMMLLRDPGAKRCWL